MLKKHMAACLFATALMAVPAVAQTGTSPSTSSGASSSSAAASSGQFMTHPQANQWRASKLVGVNIYGADHQKIGDVNDVLVDHTGKAEAVVIGVGGFLGIGEKDVAVPFSAIPWREKRGDPPTGPANPPAGSASGTTATTGAGTGNMAATSAGGAPTAGAGAGTTAPSTTASNTAAGTSASNTAATGSTNR